MSRKEIRNILLLIVEVIAILTVKVFSLPNETYDNSALEPEHIGNQGDYQTLSFGEKGRISLTRYGFVKELKVTEPSVII